MLWPTVWTVLVLATLAGAFWLGRDLWRKGRALMAEVEGAADALGALADRAEALTAAAAAAPVTHDVLADPAEVRARLEALRVRRAEHRAARAVRHGATYAGWRRYTR